jgi:hypothetical protein
MGASTNLATGGGIVSRRWPAGVSRKSLTDSIAASNPLSSGRSCVSSRSPASVGATLRVVRVQQPHAEMILQRTHRLAQRCCGKPEPPRRPGKARLLSDSYKGGKFGKMGSSHHQPHK